ncbi:uncharacterized protein N7529_011738 [Penicillium soppii]|uniref:uncharacterized protein n=1 Tax=Penicillium soppii TaxID=69789 RepID=UPI0025489BEE|nr:uncharacterized protein N7529_011738 [Penicillium soppii]KAJ5852353.1 hypothetical protein N7529_011738 [Penicillium soppii]
MQAKAKHRFPSNTLGVINCALHPRGSFGANLLLDKPREKPANSRENPAKCQQTIHISDLPFQLLAQMAGFIT